MSPPISSNRSRISVFASSSPQESLIPGYSGFTNLVPQIFRDNFSFRTLLSRPSFSNPGSGLFRNDLTATLRRWLDSYGPGSGDPNPNPEEVSTSSPLTQLWHGIMVGLGVEPAAEPTENLVDPLPSDVVEQYLLVEKVPAEERQALWEQAIAQLRLEGFSCPPEYTASYEDFHAHMESLGVRLPARVQSLRCALTLLQNRESLGRGLIDQPIAVVIAGTADHNGAFSAGGGYPLLDRLVESGRFHVLYFEASEENEVMETLEQVARLSGHRIHTLVLGGHGNAQMLSLNGPDPGHAPSIQVETDFVDTRDFSDGDFVHLEEYLEPTGQVILWSCSNGSGGAGAYNMANVFASALPNRHIYSTQEPGNIRSLEIRDDLSLDIVWSNAAPYVAFIPEGEEFRPLRPNRNRAG